MNVAALAKAAGIVHHDGLLAGLDVPRSMAAADDRTTIGSDALSFYIGARFTHLE